MIPATLIGSRARSVSGTESRLGPARASTHGNSTLQPLEHENEEGPMAQLTKQVPSVGRNNQQSTKVGNAPSAGTVTRVTYTPVSSITFKSGEGRTFTCRNTTMNTTIAQVTINQSVTIPGGEPYSIPLDVTTLGANDEVVWTSAPVGSGVADPGGTVTVTY